MRIDKEQTMEAIAKVAHWQPHPSLDDIYCVYYHCSNCKHIVCVTHGSDVFERHPYCGRCGYEMKREVKP